MHKIVSLNTTRSIEFIDITQYVKDFVKENKIKNGFVGIYTRHTTSGIRINENESNLVNDMVFGLESLFPSGTRRLHDLFSLDGRPNAHSHLKALLLGASEFVPVVNGELFLGKFQSIFFVELDGGRKNREFVLVC